VRINVVALLTTAEEQFAEVDARYSSSDDTQLLRVGAVEDRILSLQRQLEERSRAELNSAVRVVDYCLLFVVIH